ncbi:MAG TPA: TIGR03118 family protein [Chitinophagaceae bacterium]
MKTILVRAGNLYWILACLVLSITACQKNIEKPAANLPDDKAQAAAVDERRLKGDFDQVNIVGDDNEFSPLRVDPNLINAWGMAFAPSGPDWVNAMGTGFSDIFNTQGADLIPPVSIPSPGNDSMGGHPTGIVFNASSGFKLPNGNPARFIFVGVDGIISGWNGGSHAIRVFDNSATSVYTGLAIATEGKDSFIYAANFRAHRIDVYNKNWTKVFRPFFDFFIPGGYAPFNVQNVNNNLFVTYAKVGDDGEEEKGAGKGFVDVFRSNGRFVTRFASRGILNAPWGVAMAPASWANQKWDGNDDDDDNGKSGSDNDKHHHDFNKIKQVFLIGNFGDGTINAFNQDGEFIGRLRSSGKTIRIDGLWAISFAPSTAATIDPNWLFFAAGPGDENHGLFGYLKKN